MELYYNYFPIFIPFQLHSVFNIQNSIGMLSNCISWEDYYYKVVNSDFYLLDLSLVKFFEISFKKLRKQFKFGKLQGDLYFVSKEEIERLDLSLKKDYSRAFIFVIDLQKRQFSAIIYFIINKEKIMGIFVDE